MKNSAFDNSNNMPTSYYEEPKNKKYGADGCMMFYQPSKPNEIAAQAHIHDILELIYVTDGSFVAQVNNSVYHMKIGSLLLIRSREIHRIQAENNPTNSYYVIKIDPSVIYDYSQKSSPYRYILPFKLITENKKCFFIKEDADKIGLTDTVWQMIKELSQNRYGSELAVKTGCVTLLLQILREWHGNDSDKDEKSDNLSSLIYKAVEFIHENYSNDITIEDCCRHVGLSYSYFSRLFKQTMGTSYKEYLNYLRCNQAEKLLITTDKPISEIATECGYGETCYFIQKFKETREMTPGKYRKEYKA